jgi:predicted GIY-YIG superfamily endonuclease
MQKKQVYIIFNELLNLIKIGVTNNIPRRLRQLECSSGCKLELYYHTEPIYNATKIEKSLHQYFNLKRKEGEYFFISAEEAKEKLLFMISNLTKVYTDNL